MCKQFPKNSYGPLLSNVLELTGWLSWQHIAFYIYQMITLKDRFQSPVVRRWISLTGQIQGFQLPHNVSKFRQPPTVTVDLIPRLEKRVFIINVFLLKTHGFPIVYTAPPCTSYSLPLEEKEKLEVFIPGSTWGTWGTHCHQL